MPKKTPKTSAATVPPPQVPPVPQVSPSPVPPCCTACNTPHDRARNGMTLVGDRILFRCATCGQHNEILPIRPDLPVETR